MRSVLALAVCALAASGCGKQLNSAYCESALHQNDPDCHTGSIFLDASIDAAIPCSGNDGCASHPMDPVCDTSRGVCVQCLQNAQCTPMTPVCDHGTDTCRGCVADSECPGMGPRCLADGTCAEASELIYVDSAGADEGTCTVTSPCNTITKGIAAAIASGKHLITATGSFNENVQFNSTPMLRLDCEPGTTLSGADDQKPILEFVGTTIADIYRLTIKGNQNQTAGVQLTAGGTQTVGLYEVAVTGPPGPVNNSGTRTPAPGIEIQAGNLTMKRSIVSGFEPVGVQFETTAGDFDLETNFIYDNGYQKNGAGGTPYGGVAILVANGAGSTFGWNTVAFNGNTNNGRSAGVYCSSGLASSTSTGNLFFHNQGGSTNEFSTACQLTTSQQGADPSFLNPNLPYDLHLSATSTAAVDKAGKACMNQVDFDGDARPIGAQCDYGADEYHP